MTSLMLVALVLALQALPGRTLAATKARDGAEIQLGDYNVLRDTWRSMTPEKLGEDLVKEELGEDLVTEELGEDLVKEQFIITSQPPFSVGLHGQTSKVVIEGEGEPELPHFGDLQLQHLTRDSTSQRAVELTKDSHNPLRHSQARNGDISETVLSERDNPLLQNERVVNEKSNQHKNTDGSKSNLLSEDRTDRVGLHLNITKPKNYDSNRIVQDGIRQLPLYKWIPSETRNINSPKNPILNLYVKEQIANVRDATAVSKEALRQRVFNPSNIRFSHQHSLNPDALISPRRSKRSLRNEMRHGPDRQAVRKDSSKDNKALHTQPTKGKWNNPWETPRFQWMESPALSHMPLPQSRPSRQGDGRRVENIVEDRSRTAQPGNTHRQPMDNSENLQVGSGAYQTYGSGVNIGDNDVDSEDDDIDNIDDEDKASIDVKTGVSQDSLIRRGLSGQGSEDLKKEKPPLSVPQESELRPQVQSTGLKISSIASRGTIINAKAASVAGTTAPPRLLLTGRGLRPPRNPRFGFKPLDSSFFNRGYQHNQFQQGVQSSRQGPGVYQQGILAWSQNKSQQQPGPSHKRPVSPQDSGLLQQEHDAKLATAQGVSRSQPQGFHPRSQQGYIPPTHRFGSAQPYNGPPIPGLGQQRPQGSSPQDRDQGTSTHRGFGATRGQGFGPPDRRLEIPIPGPNQIRSGSAVGQPVNVGGHYVNSLPHAGYQILYKLPSETPPHLQNSPILFGTAARQRVHLPLDYLSNKARPDLSINAGGRGPETNQRRVTPLHQRPVSGVGRGGLTENVMKQQGQDTESVRSSHGQTSLGNLPRQAGYVSSTEAPQAGGNATGRGLQVDAGLRNRDSGASPSQRPLTHPSDRKREREEVFDVYGRGSTTSTQGPRTLHAEHSPNLSHAGGSPDPRHRHVHEHRRNQASLQTSSSRTSMTGLSGLPATLVTLPPPPPPQMHTTFGPSLVNHRQNYGRHRTDYRIDHPPALKANAEPPFGGSGDTDHSDGTRRSSGGQGSLAPGIRAEDARTEGSHSIAGRSDLGGNAAEQFDRHALYLKNLQLIKFLLSEALDHLISAPTAELGDALCQAIKTATSPDVGNVTRSWAGSDVKGDPILSLSESLETLRLAKARPDRGSTRPPGTAIQGGGARPEDDAVAGRRMSTSRTLGDTMGREDGSRVTAPGYSGVRDRAGAGQTTVASPFTGASQVHTGQGGGTDGSGEDEEKQKVWALWKSQQGGKACELGTWSAWSGPVGFGVIERRRAPVSDRDECKQQAAHASIGDLVMRVDISVFNANQTYYKTPQEVGRDFEADFTRRASAPEPRDILLVLDASGSILEEDFQLMRDGLDVMVRLFCGGFDSSEHNNRLAILTFASDVVVVHKFSDEQRSETLRHVIASMNQTNGNTCTGDALKLARDVIFTTENGARPNVVHDTLLVTDGHSNCGEITIQEGAQLLRNVSNVFALGVGLANDTAARLELSSVVSNSDPRHIFSLARFQDFKHMLDSIERRQGELSSCLPIVEVPASASGDQEDSAGEE